MNPIAHRLTISVLALASVGVTEAATTRPLTTRPTGPASRPAVARPAKPVAKPAESPAVAAAVAAISLTYDEWAKKPDELPSEGTYFGEHADAALTQDDVIAALGKRWAGDAVKDAYIKWQVLSAVSGMFDGKNAVEALRLYHKPPAIPMRVGSRTGEAQKFQQALQRFDRNDRERVLSETNSGLEQAIAQWRAQADPILRYRSALYARIPTGYETFMAGLADALGRAQAGVDPKSHFDAVANSIRSWAAGGANAGQVSQIVRVLTALQREPGAEVLTGLKWNGDKNRYEWEWKNTEIERKMLENLVSELGPKGGGR